MSTHGHRTCFVEGCSYKVKDDGLCREHYRLRLRGVAVLPCPVCSEPMREPAEACGFCLDMGRRAAA